MTLADRQQLRQLQCPTVVQFAPYSSGRLRSPDVEGQTVNSGALRRSRVERGWLQADLARAAHVAMSHVSRLERGEAKASARALRRIADVLDVNIRDLIVDELTALNPSQDDALVVKHEHSGEPQ